MSVTREMKHLKCIILLNQVKMAREKKNGKTLYILEIRKNQQKLDLYYQITHKMKET